ncbi:hypothetical protein RJT34_03409 [Clitoria ternatea]|uniref:Uncharacterized protein n=1 Tax=Clitoria ternatea TaxID=43366 RepID=A0AAN9KM52_CLITE
MWTGCVMCKGPIIKVGRAAVVIALTWNAWASICSWCALMPTWVQRSDAQWRGNTQLQENGVAGPTRTHTDGERGPRNSQPRHNGKFLRFTQKSTNMALITSLENTIAESNM